MEYIVFAALVFLSTVIWPVNRWVVRNGGRTVGVGIVISITVAVLATIIALCTGNSVIHPIATPLGVVMGFAYSIGFCVLIFECLRIGPAGLTTVANNMGILAVIATEMIFFSAKPPTITTFIGLLLIICALIVLSTGRDLRESISKRWLVLVILGWLCACVSMVSQFLTSQLASASEVWAYVLSGYFVSFLVLTAIHIYKKAEKINKVEIVGGITTALISICIFPLNFYLLNELKVPGAVVFPVTLSLPIVVMLIIGAVVYREKISAKSFIACLAVIGGVVLLKLM